MIQTGEQAPDFELSDHDGNPVRLSGLRGRPVVLLSEGSAGTRSWSHTLKLAAAVPADVVLLNLDLVRADAVRGQQLRDLLGVDVVERQLLVIAQVLDDLLGGHHGHGPEELAQLRQQQRSVVVATGVLVG